MQGSHQTWLGSLGWRSKAGRSTITSKGTTMAAMWFSTSLEEIHSPPDLMRSLERSVMMSSPSFEILAYEYE